MWGKADKTRPQGFTYMHKCIKMRTIVYSSVADIKRWSRITRGK